jgi:hypothetical protein
MKMEKVMYRFICSCNNKFKYKKDLKRHQRLKNHNDPDILCINADLRNVDEWIKLRETAKKKFNGKTYSIVVIDPPYPGT